MLFCLKTKIFAYDYVAQYLAAIIVSIGVLAEGMHYGWSSSAIPKLLAKNSSSMSKIDALYITQMFTYGSIAFTVLSIADYPKLNQKSGVILSVLIMTISWIMIGFSNSNLLLMIARFFAGVGRGICYQVSLNYICEIADPKIRGLLGSQVFVMTNLGVLLIYSFVPYLDIMWSSLIGAIICLTEMFAIKWIPESPYILLLRGRTEQARQVLRNLRRLWNVEEELEALTNIVKRQNDENFNFWTVVTVKSNRKAIFMILMFSALQALTGINISIHKILKLAGGNQDSYNFTVISSFCSVIACALVAVLLDHIGRRPLLIISFAASGLSMGILGFYSAISKLYHLDNFEILPILFVLLFTIFYKMGIGMIPLLMAGELFPMNVKNTAATLNEIFSIIFNFASIAIFNIIKTSYVLYWFCGINCFIGAFYTYLFVIETKGKSLEEIQCILKSNGKCKSNINSNINITNL